MKEEKIRIEKKIGDGGLQKMEDYIKMI